MFNPGVLDAGAVQAEEDADPVFIPLVIDMGKGVDALAVVVE